jgi:nicotinamide riboside transporter PnuC
MIFFSNPLYNTIFTDAFVPGVTIICNVLMCLKFKNQWQAWIVLDVIEVIVWTQYLLRSLAHPHLLTDYGMNPSVVISILSIWVVQLGNAIYGYREWSKNAKLQEVA